ncbi:hypothetical protein [uncultured Cyclobacterium sp.]|uniref:hypothetical protein n=1 Tax=uncultured Cyclobacterium sp. TaxID=453820 RepID=UPI0030EC3F98|tara:strand:- start:125792 stop:126112 length:321 start_codon:yes stop_codon:yes gene_type:complete
MKKNKWITVLVILSIFILTKCGEKRSGVVDVKFTTELTQVDLDKIQIDLKSQNIALTYDLLEFDERGFLKKIDASIDYNDGQKGSFKSSELQSTDGPGFYRDFSNE